MPKQNPSQPQDSGPPILDSRVYWETLCAIVSRKTQDAPGRLLSFEQQEEAIINLAQQETDTDFSPVQSKIAPNLTAMYLCDFLSMSEQHKISRNTSDKAKEKIKELEKQLCALRTDLIGHRDNRKQLQWAIVRNDSLDKIDEETAKLLWEVNELEIESAKGIVKQDYRRILAAKRQRLSVLKEAKDYLLLDILNTDAGKAIQDIDSTLKILCAEFISLGYDLYEALKEIEAAENERKEYLTSEQRKEDLLSQISLIQAFAQKPETAFPVTPAKPETPLCPGKIIEEMENILQNDPLLFGSCAAGKTPAKTSIVLLPHAEFGQFSSKEHAFFVPVRPKENLQDMLISLAALYRLSESGNKQNFIKYRQAANIPPETEPEKFTQKFISDYKQWQTTDSKGFHSLPGKVRDWFMKTLQNAE